MNLVTCKLCGKVFSSSRGKICPECLDEVDNLYRRVREFLRDNASRNYDVESLSEATGIDIRYIQALIDLKYIDRDVQSNFKDEEQEKKDRLLKEFQKNLDKGNRRHESAEKTRTYGQERYGSKGRTKK
ncbi:MAG: hypothetical protein WCQ97_03340 [Aminobacterium sp.]|uniref:hypothetical protein n=1 Tax=unclassified Aminobacterium TaxID=2685012 RepID=UPI001BD0AB9E|nr:MULTISPECIES: hypothetical protein [unclassified Aminobacterium]MDD2206582.1 hypothetical protein [Aminobacterium sp.]MDD3425505.1 hypothetical protein [Aminobacterium sp.]MDD3706854.1 hypothetical protein [Aminobacterium sp.]MDD4228671.1 hypothetical protein [Aminobacterium sp.]MDD4551599.1 hypothetical protein [Aminobacterium sp.]